MDVLQEWGCTRLWEGMRLTGDDSWLEEAIQDNSLVAVTDGSYMRDKFPTMNSWAFILECTKGRGRLMGDFLEQIIAACSYRGELIGLLAIHLILLSVSRVAPELTGSVHIYSDCLGALEKVKNLPPHCIPSKCRHSDVLKNIMVHFSDLSFTRLFSHVSAHQDDRTKFEDLTRPAQLNCADHGWGKGGTGRNGDCRRKPHRRALNYIVVYRTTVIWLSSHMYPGESPGRRVALSSGSDCDAVWLWPSAYEDSFNG